MQFWLISNQLHDIFITLQRYTDFYYHVSSDKSRTSNKRRTVSQSGQIKYLTLIRAPGYLWCIFLFSPLFFLCSSNSFVCIILLCSRLQRANFCFDANFIAFSSDIHPCILKVVPIICVEFRLKIVTGTVEQGNRSIQTNTDVTERLE